MHPTPGQTDRRTGLTGHGFSGTGWSNEGRPASLVRRLIGADKELVTQAFMRILNAGQLS